MHACSIGGKGAGAGRKMKQTAVVASAALHGYPGTNLPPGSYGSYPTAP